MNMMGQFPLLLSNQLLLCMCTVKCLVSHTGEGSTELHSTLLYTALNRMAPDFHLVEQELFLPGTWNRAHNTSISKGSKHILNGVVDWGMFKKWGGHLKFPHFSFIYLYFLIHSMYISEYKYMCFPLFYFFCWFCVSVRPPNPCVFIHPLPLCPSPIYVSCESFNS